MGERAKKFLAIWGEGWIRAYISKHTTPYENIYAYTEEQYSHSFYTSGWAAVSVYWLIIFWPSVVWLSAPLLLLLLLLTAVSSVNPFRILDASVRAFRAARGAYSKLGCYPSLEYIDFVFACLWFVCILYYIWCGKLFGFHSRDMKVRVNNINDNDSCDFLLTFFFFWGILRRPARDKWQI